MAITPRLVDVILDIQMLDFSGNPFFGKNIEKFSLVTDLCLWFFLHL